MLNNYEEIKKETFKYDLVLEQVDRNNFAV